ncbi:MAG TPA: TIGR03089 family protein [Micromonosporaceae bacterium]|jgi:uncharacterized protein (TIGR03089 family)|nr:TIGR03089 family protein [Micromonosporaceae bacterium]
MHVGALLARAVAAEPARPLITYYDDATGERTELSAATLANWVAKTANLLVDGCGLGPGDRALVDLPPHWQTAAVLLGCWSAGLVPAGQDPDVVFATEDRAAGYSGEVFGLALAPLGAPMRSVPAGVTDYVVEVRGHGDHFAPPTVDQSDLCRRAYRRAAEAGIGSGDRVLVDAAVSTDPVDWLLAPLAAGASIVLCGHFDPAKRAGRIATERISVELTAAPPAAQTP